MYRTEFKKKYQRTEQTMCIRYTYLLIVSKKKIRFILGISTRIIYMGKEHLTLMEKV